MTSSPDIEALIQTGLDLEKAGSDQEALDRVVDYFRSLVSQYPDHARVQFETGGAYDSAGYEAEAITHYERAIELGLSGEDAIRINVQLGSSLRNVGQIEAAVALLKQACADHPDYIALRAFYALALTSAGQSTAAVVELLEALLRRPTALEAYHRSLRNYTNELRKTIDGSSS